MGNKASNDNQSDQTQRQQLLIVPKKKKKPVARRYRWIRYEVYKFLEQPKKYASFYHGFVFLMITTSFLFSVLLTIGQFERDELLLEIVSIFEICILFVFVTEGTLRVWACGSVPKYSGVRGKVKFCLNFYMLVDFLSIAATLGTIIPYKILSDQDTYFELSMMRVTRFVQIFRILRMDRQRGDFRKMGRLIMKHKKELLISYYIGFMVLVLSAYAVYSIEYRLLGDDALIKNLSDSVYWGIITVAMVGYGDLSPKHWSSKLITCLFSFVGVTMFAMPGGIVGSGFALEVARERKKQRERRVHTPAARYIQRWWRTIKLIHKLKQAKYGRLFSMKTPGHLSQQINLVAAMPFKHECIEQMDNHVAATSERKESIKELKTLKLGQLELPKFLVKEDNTSVQNLEVDFVEMNITQHLCLIFYFQLLELAALKRFNRARNPVFNLEDVIMQAKIRKIHVGRQLDRLDSKIKPMKDLDRKMREINWLMQDIDQLATKVFQLQHQSNMEGKETNSSNSLDGRLSASSEKNSSIGSLPEIRIIKTMNDNDGF